MEMGSVEIYIFILLGCVLKSKIRRKSKSIKNAHRIYLQNKYFLSIYNKQMYFLLIHPFDFPIFIYTIR